MPRPKTFDETTVLQKAIDLFWEKGYHATSIQDLVDHLGINRASLYSTFGDKKTLFDQAFAHYRQAQSAGLQAFLDQHNDVRAGLSALFSQAIEATRTDKKGCFVVNVTTEMLPTDPSLAPVLQANQAKMEALFYAYLLRGERQGEIAAGKDLHALAGLFFTLYNGLQVVGKIPGSEPSLRAALASALQLLD
jgi:TetR/AcrR family transcriptional repressor of nem operon